MRNLYKDKEIVKCFCNKCGFLGEASAPTFLHNECGYSASPLDRAEKAEARVTELEIENANLRQQLLRFDPPEGLGY